MADKTSAGDVSVERDNNGTPQGEAPLEKGDNKIPSITRGEIGQSGLLVLGGEVLEECSRELRWPECIKTFKKMEKDGTIAPALELVEMMISRVPWHVKVPEGYEEELAQKAQFVRQNMDDMEIPWSTFIKQASTCNRYGFSIAEKVYRYRRKKDGSRYDDGLIGLRTLASRSQDSVQGWTYSANGRKVTGFVQAAAVPSGAMKPNDKGGFSHYEAGHTESKGIEQRFIPRNKLSLIHI